MATLVGTEKEQREARERRQFDKASEMVAIDEWAEVMRTRLKREMPIESAVGAEILDNAKKRNAKPENNHKPQKLDPCFCRMYELDSQEQQQQESAPAKQLDLRQIGINREVEEVLAKSGEAD